jgi:hypothetical protein
VSLPARACGFGVALCVHVQRMTVNASWISWMDSDIVHVHHAACPLSYLTPVLLPAPCGTVAGRDGNGHLDISEMSRFFRDLFKVTHYCCCAPDLVVAGCVWLRALCDTLGQAVVSMCVCVCGAQHLAPAPVSTQSVTQHVSKG